MPPAELLVSSPAEQIKIRRICKHGRSHPHTVTIFDSTVATEAFRWCTDGDFAVLTREELRIQLFALLTERDPRIDLATAAEKAEQLVTGLFELIRPSKGDQ